MFDSSMINEPSGFEPLKFYCTVFGLNNKVVTLIDQLHHNSRVERKTDVSQLVVFPQT